MPLGKILLRPLETFFTVSIHTLDNKKESLIKKISDILTMAFGVLSMGSTLNLIGCGVGLGVSAGVDFIVSVISRTPFTMSVEAQYKLAMIKVSLCVGATSFLLFNLSSYARDYLHAS